MSAPFLSGWRARVGRGARAVPAWVAWNSEVLTFAAAVGGVALRIWTSSGTFLSPDEALHLRIARAGGLAEVLAATRTNAHPPLFFLFLAVWSRLGTSEAWLRLPSVLAGGAAILLGARWVRRVCGRRASVAMAFALAFGPPLVALSAEVRGYSIFLALLLSSLAAFPEALGRGSPGRVTAVVLPLALACLIHYSGLLAAASMLFVALLPRRVSGARSGRPWWIGSAGAFGLLAFEMWEFHLRNLRGGIHEVVARETWLRSGYFRPGEGGPVKFVVLRLAELYSGILGSDLPGLLALAVVPLGLVYLWRRGQAGLPVVALALAAAAALGGYYPLGGTRHSTWLFPAALLPLVAVIPLAGPRRASPVLLAGLAAVPLWLWVARPPDLSSLPARAQRRGQLETFVGDLFGKVPAGGTFVTDHQTAALLGWYACPSANLGWGTPGTLLTADCRGRRVVVSQAWVLDLSTLDQRLGEARPLLPGASSEGVWVATGGPGSGLAGQLVREDAGRIQEGPFLHGEALCLVRLRR